MSSFIAATSVPYAARQNGVAPSVFTPSRSKLYDMYQRCFVRRAFTSAPGLDQRLHELEVRRLLLLLRRRLRVQRLRRPLHVDRRVERRRPRVAGEFRVGAALEQHHGEIEVAVDRCHEQRARVIALAHLVDLRRPASSSAIAAVDVALAHWRTAGASGRPCCRRARRTQIARSSRRANRWMPRRDPASRRRAGCRAVGIDATRALGGIAAGRRAAPESRLRRVAAWRPHASYAAVRAVARRHQRGLRRGVAACVRRSVAGVSGGQRRGPRRLFGGLERGDASITQLIRRAVGTLARGNVFDLRDCFDVWRRA